MDSLSAKIRGSARVDLSTKVDCTVWDNKVQKIPLNVKGLIGEGCSAILLGRSCTTLTGLFVLLGVINSDYEGIIHVMVWTPSPPVHVPSGTQLAQLILFKAIVPCTETNTRGDTGFGSTGQPKILWATTLATSRPVMTLTFYYPKPTQTTQALFLCWWTLGLMSRL